jgi:hypothetical protein
VICFVLIKRHMDSKPATTPAQTTSTSLIPAGK